MRGRLVGVVEEFARETSAAESWSPSTRRTLSIGSRELAGVANNLCHVLHTPHCSLLQPNPQSFR